MAELVGGRSRWLVVLSCIIRSRYLETTSEQTEEAAFNNSVIDLDPVSSH
jgi:hypothetical protein